MEQRRLAPPPNLPFFQQDRDFREVAGLGGVPTSVIQFCHGWGPPWDGHGAQGGGGHWEVPATLSPPPTPPHPQPPSPSPPPLFPSPSPPPPHPPAPCPTWPGPRWTWRPCAAQAAFRSGPCRGGGGNTASPWCLASRPVRPPSSMQALSAEAAKFSDANQPQTHTVGGPGPKDTLVVRKQRRWVPPALDRGTRSPPELTPAHG